MSRVRLDQYCIAESYSPNAGILKQCFWFFLGESLFRSKILFSSSLKCFILRFFGAKVGIGVRIKPLVRVKFPWKLEIGDYSWLGESVWIDNLAQVTIGSHVCISQGVYFCTGNHDWSSKTFDLKTDEIHVGSESWIGAQSSIGPGVSIGNGSVLTLGSVASKSLQPWSIYSGNPAIKTKERKFHTPH